MPTRMSDATSTCSELNMVVFAEQNRNLLTPLDEDSNTALADSDLSLREM